MQNIKRKKNGQVGESNITGKDQEKKKRAKQTNADNGQGKNTDRDHGQAKQAKSMDMGSWAGTTGEGNGLVRW